MNVGHIRYSVSRIDTEGKYISWLLIEYWKEMMIETFLTREFLSVVIECKWIYRSINRMPFNFKFYQRNMQKESFFPRLLFELLLRFLYKKRYGKLFRFFSLQIQYLVHKLMFWHFGTESAEYPKTMRNSRTCSSIIFHKIFRCITTMKTWDAKLSQILFDAEI